MRKNGCRLVIPGLETISDSNIPDSNATLRSFINVKGLPWDVTSEEVRSFFEIFPISKWSCCRPAARNGHAILAFSFRFAALVIVQRCNGSRVFGAVPLDVAVVNPDHAKRRVFCSGLPFAFSEKAAVDVERMVKDVQVSSAYSALLCRTFRRFQEVCWVCFCSQVERLWIVGDLTWQHKMLRCWSCFLSSVLASH